MNMATEILVIILSVVLVVFLILGIVLAVILIRVTRQIKKVTDSAGRTAETIESAVSNITKFTSPIVIAAAVAKQLKRFRKRK